MWVGSRLSVLLGEVSANGRWRYRRFDCTPNWMARGKQYIFLTGGPVTPLPPIGPAWPVVPWSGKITSLHELDFKTTGKENNGKTSQENQTALKKVKPGPEYLSSTVSLESLCTCLSNRTLSWWKRLPLKGQSYGYFLIFITNLLNLCRSTLLMHKLFSDYWGNKIKGIFKQKTSQISFYLFYLRHESTNLTGKNLPEDFKLECIPSWPFPTRYIY